jgi:hypothetical protein
MQVYTGYLQYELPAGLNPPRASNVAVCANMTYIQQHWQCAPLAVLPGRASLPDQNLSSRAQPAVSAMQKPLSRPVPRCVCGHMQARA